MKSLWNCRPTPNQESLWSPIPWPSRGEDSQRGVVAGKTEAWTDHYFAEQRAVNLKKYLVHEKGVDPYRVAITTGTDDDRDGRAYLVPAGVSFEAEVQGTTWINDSAFEPQKQ